MKRFPDSSKTNSRRSSRGRLRRFPPRYCALLPITLFLLLPGLLPAQAIDARVTRHSNATLVQLRVDQVDAERILEPLSTGLESEIEFVVRHYAQGRGLTALLGDRLIAEQRRVYAVRWDPFADQYVMWDAGSNGEEAGGLRDRRRFDDATELLDAFLRSPDIVLTGPVTGRGDYLMVQAQLQPVRFVPALGILATLLPNDTISTPWRRITLKQDA